MFWIQPKFLKIKDMFETKEEERGGVWNIPSIQT